MPHYIIRSLLKLFALTACSLLGAATDTQKNILLLCIDDLRPELKSFGVDYIHSPNIDRLAETGRAFHRHYVNAPTCGASRYSLLTGQYGSSSNQALFHRAEQMDAPNAAVNPSLPEWFRKNGYTTVSVGKVSHHPGGWGGEDWYDNNILEMPGAWDRQLMPTGPWRHPRGAMHSFADGEIRMGRSFTENKMDALQSADVDDTSYNDGLIAQAGIHQLKDLAQSDSPFFLAIGLIKPHLPFGAPARYMEPYRHNELPPIPYSEKPDWRTTWHGSGEFFRQYNHYDQDPRQDREYADEVRRHYAACVTYVDKLVGDILQALESSGKADDTIIVLWGDHGWNLGEHAIWGKHNLFEEALRSPLIISLPDMEHPGQKTDAIVETADIFPTLCELAKLEVPTFLHGESLLPILNDPTASGHPAYSYWRKAKTIRTETHRFILHEDGYAELYDHTSPLKETQNLAEQRPRLVERYTQLLRQESSLH